MTKRRLFFFLLLMLASCTKTLPPQPQLSSEERPWMDLLFREIFLEHAGIYTLCGTKPMTEISLHYYSPKEIEDLWEGVSVEEKKDYREVEDCHLEDNWDKWQAIKNKFPMKNYRFILRNHPSEKKVKLLYFINLKELRNVLRNHYELFEPFLGKGFSIEKTIASLDDQTSNFWKQRRNSHLFCGILFGFGEEASIAFDHYYAVRRTDPGPFIVSDNVEWGHATTTQFSLPIFMIEQGKESKQLIKYRKEREKIQNHYKNKDFLEETLRLLTQQ